MVLKDENKKNETWLHFSRVRQALEKTLPYLITDNKNIIRKHEDYLGHCIVNESAVSWADPTVDKMSRTKGKEVKNTGTLNFHIYFVYLQAFNDLAYFNVYIFGYSFFFCYFAELWKSRKFFLLTMAFFSHHLKVVVDVKSMEIIPWD